MKISVSDTMMMDNNNNNKHNNNNVYFCSYFYNIHERI